MSEPKFGGDAGLPMVAVESQPEKVKKEVKVKIIAEGASTGWEGEQTLTEGAVMEAIKELVGANVGDVEITDKVLSHDGVILSLHVRAPGSASSYYYMLKGVHGVGGSFTERTHIGCIDYKGPDSEDVYFAEEIAEYAEGAWKK